MILKNDCRKALAVRLSSDLEKKRANGLNAARHLNPLSIEKYGGNVSLLSNQLLHFRFILGKFG